MPNKDIVIPIVFPDYLITVDTPAVKIDVPKFPGSGILPRQFTIPKTKQKVPYLGHAGILFIEGKTGLTKYYEYGRYDPAAKGLVKNRPIPDMKMGKDGRPTKKSLVAVLAAVSRTAKQPGRDKISGAYIELEPGAFAKMLTYAKAREKLNSDASRTPYALLSHTCLHFMKSTAEAGGASMPRVLAPQPAGYIVQVRGQHNDLDFVPPSDLTVDDITFK